jgi:23S rRNA pseudouridine2605 synthase
VRKSGIKVTAKAAREVDDGKVRLNRYLAMAGVCSRRAADELITSGSVEVNGKTITELGFRLDPAVDEVVVDGERVRQEKKVYVLFNKPTGVVCTNARNEQKKRVIDFLPAVKGRLFTVGRLDLDSEGLILLTNDGDFAQRLTHPRYGVPKTYSVLVRGRIGQKEIEKARGGVWLSEGPTQGMQVKVERAGNERSSIKVVLHEGKNREIRRVFAKLDLPVLELKRIRIGELNLHGLKPGDWRFLLAHEIKELLELSAAAAGEAAPAADVADAATRSAWNSGKSTGKKSAPKKTATKKPEPEGGGDDSDVDDGDEW